MKLALYALVATVTLNAAIALVCHQKAPGSEATTCQGLMCALMTAVYPFGGGAEFQTCGTQVQWTSDLGPVMTASVLGFMSTGDGQINKQVVVRCNTTLCNVSKPVPDCSIPTGPPNDGLLNCSQESTLSAQETAATPCRGGCCTTTKYVEYPGSVMYPGRFKKECVAAAECEHVFSIIEQQTVYQQGKIHIIQVKCRTGDNCNDGRDETCWPAPETPASASLATTTAPAISEGTSTAPKSNTAAPIINTATAPTANPVTAALSDAPGTATTADTATTQAANQETTPEKPAPAESQANNENTTAGTGLMVAVFNVVGSAILLLL